MKQKIVIIGAGEIGRAIGGILSKKNNSVELWDKKPAKVRGQKPLVDIVSSADFVFLCVPSWAVREAINGIKSYLKKNTVVIALAKGVEIKSKKTAPEIMGEILPRQPQVFIGGSMLAEELSLGKVGIGAVAARDKKTFDKFAKLFKNTNLKLEYLDDARGVALAGVLKNIYAIGLGVVDAIGLGDNLKGWFVVQASAEMAEIIKILGGKRETAYTVAGLGDLIATGFSPYSRNREVGRDLVKKGRCCLQSEGAVSFPPLVKLLGKKIDKFPLFLALYSVITKNKNPKKIFRNFVNRA